MKYNDYLITEIQLGTTDPKLEDLFNLGLRQIFTNEYLNKVENKVNRIIKVKIVNSNNPNIIAYSYGRNINVNKNEFFKRSREQQVKYLLHEFIHILQRSKSFMLLKSFKELHSITKHLNKIVKQNLRTNLSVFLTGRNTDIGRGGKLEILAYLLNNSIDWSSLGIEGKKEFIQVLQDAKIFKLNSSFWRKILK